MDTAVTTSVARPKPLSAEALAYAGLLLASIGWASAFILGKVVLAQMTPLAAGAWRYAVAALVLLPFAARQWPAPGARRSLVPLLLMVVFGGIAYPWIFLLALDRTSATNTSLLVALNPMFTVLLAPFIGERLTWRRISGVGLALAGAGAVITRGDLGHLAATQINSGDILALSAAVCWALFNLASRGAVSRLSPAATNFVVYSLGGLALFALSRSEHPWAQMAAATPTVLAGIAMMALLSSVLAGQFFLVGVRTLGVSRTVVFVYLVPVLTGLASAALLGEHLEMAQAIGGTAVLGGVYLSTRPA